MVELKDGQNDVEIKNLPSLLEADSIRVDGIGNATIFDVIYRQSQSQGKLSLAYPLLFDFQIRLHALNPRTRKHLMTSIFGRRR